MSKNRFLLVLSLLSLLSVAMAVSLTRLDAPSSKDLRWLPRPVIAPSMSGVYPNAEEVRPVRPYIMDSATRSYIAWGQAMQVRNAIDSGTRSYIAWGEALQAAGKLPGSGVCSNTTPENIFAGIDSNLDSGTRSYIAWGLALQAKDEIEACR